jgi:hypothetical protein
MRAVLDSFYVRKSVRASRTISLVDVIKVDPIVDNVPFDAYFLTIQTLGMPLPGRL